MNYRILLSLSLALLLALPATGQFFDPEEETTAPVEAINEPGLLSTDRPELIEESFTLRGQISAFEFVQPETLLSLEVPGASWQIIAPSAVELRRLGWTSQSLFVGEAVEVEVVRILGAENIASLKRLTRANGALLLTQLNSDQETTQAFSDIPGGLYTLDTKQAHLQFSFDHMGFSKTSVKIERLTGTVLWNAEMPENSIIQVDIDASSLRSGVTELDDALRGDSFFDFLNYPKISFNSTALNISKWGDMSVYGQLNIIGLNQPVEFQANLNKVGVNELTQDTTVGVRLTGEVDRSAWGLVDYLPIIGSTIEIQFDGEFILTSPEQPRPFGTPINSGMNELSSPGFISPQQ